MRRLALVTVVSLLLLAGTSLAGPAWTVSSPSPFTNGSWAFGDIFTVGGSPVTVTGLGAYDAGGDGFASGSIPVGLYLESTSTLLTSTSVTGADPLTGNYRFAPISPVVLTPGTTYRVVAVSLSDLYNIATGTPSTVDPAITWDGYAYGSSGSLASLNSFTGTDITWMANAQFDVTPIPEPSTLALGGIGALVLSFVGLRRRKRRSA